MHREPKPSGRPTAGTSFSPFGWQGIRGEVPDDWNLGALGGDRQAGYLRLDDENMPRLELKWQQPQGPVNLDKVLDTYLKSLRKRTRRRRATFTVTRGVKLLSYRQKRKKELLGYSFAGEYKAHGVIWHCRTCDRILIAQVLGADQSGLKPLAIRVLSSLEDHTNDHWDLWAAYGLYVRIPDDFELVKQRLMTGHLALEFERNRREKLSVARWALANVMLKDVTLEQWAAREYPKRHREFKLRYREAEYHGHQGLEVKGDAGRLDRRLKDATKTTVLRQSVPQLRCVLWHCEPENKLFAVDAELLREREAVLDYVQQSLRCH